MFNLPMFLAIKGESFLCLSEIINEKINLNELKKVIIFTDENVYLRFREYIDLLSRNIGCAEVFFIKDSLYETAVNMAKIVCFEGYDLLIGIGGGKVLDTAKYAAYVGKKKYIAIPTVLSNDGISSPIAVLKADNGKVKSLGCKIPEGIIIDTKVIKDSPDEYLIAGIGDMLSNYTALYDWLLQFKHQKIPINDFAYLLADTSLNMLLHTDENNLKSEVFITQLAQSLILSGIAMEIAGNSRPCSGSEHLFSHALDEFFSVNIPHGIKVAIGTLASSIFQERDYSIITNFLKKLNIKINLEFFGITEKIFIQAWKLAPLTRPDRFTILNIRDINDKYLKEVYYEVLEVLK